LVYVEQALPSDSVDAGAVPAFSQTADASLTGTVLDPSGAAIGGARVTIRNQANGATRTTVTNSAGVYLIPALPPATYELTMEHPGFQKYVYGSMVLDVGAKQSLNVTLTVGATTDSVEVQAAASDIQAVTSSIGNVITGKKLEELPLVGRSVYDLINTTAGVAGVYDPTTRSITTQNFNGTRSGALNITLDGGNIQDAFFDGLAATAATSIVNVDRIAEYKIVTSPADAEYGRGSGQIIMVSRSGTNRFHGSLFEEFRNTVLTANSWFNNFNRVPRDFLAKNQFGGRFGGPILKDRLFFNFHYEGQRQRQHNLVNSAVYTQTARQGLFRFFPGVITANAFAANPTVDLAGNPVTPRGATGPLQTVSVFGLDPLRNAPDPTGNMQKIIGLQPLPNNYRIGDGLNVAGYQWSPVLQNDYDESDFRIDYAVMTNHRFSFGYSDQNSAGTNPVAVAPYPSVPNGLNATNVKTFNLGFTSVLRPNLINEFRGAALRPRIRTVAPYEIDPGILAHKGDQSLIVGIYLGGVAQPFAEGNYGGEATNRMTPVYQYSDTVTWLKGRHAFKGGAEYRFISDAGYDLYNVAERADVFTSANAPRSPNFDALPGIAPNAGSAAELASELAGSISAIYSTANSPGGKNPVFVPNLSRYRHWNRMSSTGFSRTIGR
jgi:Carboxypeptidase regulatory-like domain